MSNNVDGNEAWLKTQQFFFNKYKEKPESDLLRIVNSKANFQPEAVHAAIQILNEKYGAAISFLKEPEDVLDNKHKTRPPKQYAKFEIDNFKRTFSSREILTALSLSFFLLAYLAIIRFYSNEELIENSWVLFISSGFVITFLLNHVIYKMEHKRANTYLGRYCCDLILITFFLGIQFLYSLYSGTNSNYFSDDMLGVFFVFAILVFIFEIVLSFVKYILKFFRWEIF